MDAWLYLLNAAAVGLFGCVLSAAFCDINWTRRYIVIFAAVMAMLGLLQAALYILLPENTLSKLYPLIMHLPLTVFLTVLSRRRLWSLISVLSAYLCCQLRRWIALFFVAIWGGGEQLQAVIELAVTLPLLLLLLRFAAPAVREMSLYPLLIQLLFGLIPAAGYIFDYATRIYTDLLIQGVPAAVEFMPFICALAYPLMAIYSVRLFRRQSELEQTQKTLELQARQSAEQIAVLQHSQELAAAYRHDLRHHLQYISDCIDSGATEKAQAYIRSLHNGITNQAVVQYCKNTAVNLVLSSFASRAASADILLSVQLRLGKLTHISDNDLCVLLSNALENALNACKALRNAEKPAYIEVRGYEKAGRVFIEMINSCDNTVRLENGLPVTDRPGHGIGVRSICAVVEKYEGLHSFEVKDGRFVLRLSL